MAFVTFGLVLGNSHPDQRSSDATNRASNPQTGQRADNGAGCDQRTNAWNGQRAKAGKQPQCSANYAANRSAGGRALGRLGVFFVGEVAGALVVLEQNRDSGVGKSHAEQMIDGVLRQLWG